MMNDRSVAGLRPSARQTYFDTKTQGLALRVGARRRTWYFVYNRDNKRVWLRIGDYPDVKLADARAQVSGHRKSLDLDNINPAVERRKEPVPEPETPKAYTVADFVPAFVAFQKGRTRSWEDEHAKIKRYILPAWGTLPLRSITRAHVNELLTTVSSKGLTVGVNRLQALISRMFTVALDQGLVDAHPASRVIKRFKELPRERTLIDDEIRKLWAGLDAYPGAASDAVRLRLLLGQRGEETYGIMWNELDLDAGLWTLPLRRTKTQQRAHLVPLPSTALALLRRRHEANTANELRVFPGLVPQRDDHRELFKIHGGAYEWKDLRRTVATKLGELGFSETVIGRVLNHAKYSVTGKHYNQYAYLDEIRQALTAWDRELQRILAHEPKKKSKVVPLRGRR
jgi:integrase